MKFTDNVAKNLTMLRDEYKITQKQLGAIAKKSDKTISSWESGVRSPQIKTIKMIAQHFGIDPLALSGEQKHGEIVLTKEEKETIIALRSMDKKISNDIMERTKAAAALFPPKDAPTPTRATS